MPRVLPYGGWPSSITAAEIAAGTRRLDEPRILGGRVHWLAGLPREEGRVSVMRASTSDGTEPAALLPPPYSVRSRVNEMGGGAYTGDGERIWFVDAASQRIHVLESDARVRPLSQASACRYGDLTLDPARDRLYAVEEDHSVAGEAVTRLVTVDLMDGAIGTLAEGADFYAGPRPHPDGERITWLSWNHPDMPFDRTTLWLGELDADGDLVRAGAVDAGDPAAVCQPAWGPDGHLYFISDVDGRWHLYRLEGRGRVRLTGDHGVTEFGQPLWTLGMSCYGFLSAEQALVAGTRDGTWEVLRLDLTTGEARVMDQAFTHVERLEARDGTAVLLGGAPDRPDSVMRLCTEGGDVRADIRADIHADILASSLETSPEPAWISRPRSLRFTTGEGETAQGFFYPPNNPDCEGPPDRAPPLIVKCHGGPTGATDTALNLKFQFWTSRGFAVFDVNYRGSTGFGRAYRERLYGGWGEVDVADCAAGVRHLAHEGLVDPYHVFISGSSAGGFTVLRALLDTEVFQGGACYYGISDLEALQADTHKFESRYCDRLIAPWPEARDRYRELSPIHRSAELDRPVIFFQGSEDQVVPPDQTRTMYDALTERGVTTEYHLFEGEGHGFRGAEAIRTALESELAFYLHLLDGGEG